jgi:hypothetical protein
MADEGLCMCTTVYFDLSPCVALRTTKIRVYHDDSIEKFGPIDDG